MTDKDEAHLHQILTDTARDIDSKFRKGVAEHGGHLQDKPCLTLAIDEISDLNAYLRTAISQQEEAIKILEAIMENASGDEFTYRGTKAVLNLLKYGNKEGVIYKE